MIRTLLVILLCVLPLSTLLGAPPDNSSIAAVEAEWQAGVASTVITPQEPMWMAGYGFRDRPSEGTRHDLWAKALAIEDTGGNKGVLVSTDLLGLPKGMSDTIRDRIEEEFGLSRAQIMLNSSHTHAGPVLEDALVDIYPLDDEQRHLIASYSRHLEDQIVNLVGEALEQTEPARISAGNGVTRFAVNRRNNPAETLHEQTELRGPSDHAVPVIKVEDASGEILAVAFGYACHTTTLSEYNWSGDYAGFAQMKLEEIYPGATALFFQGAGADQNPLPRRTPELARQYGHSLAVAVQRVLDEEMEPLPSQLSTAYSEVELSLAPPPSREALAEIADESSGYPARWANRLIDKIDNEQQLIQSYPFPVQVWALGGQPIIALGGELVVGYAIELKRIFGHDAFIMGYTNDVMGYIPTTQILREGGYEGERSQMVYGLPSKWTAEVETTILQEVLRVAEEARLAIP